MHDIEGFVRDLTRDTTRADNADALFTPLRQKICTCPKCGAAITDRQKGFMCENRTCGFAIGKNGGLLKNAAEPLTAEELKKLVETGSVHKSGLVSSKSHIRYEATLHLEYDAKGRPVLKPTFEKERKATE